MGISIDYHYDRARQIIVIAMTAAVAVLSSIQGTPILNLEMTMWKKKKEVNKEKKKEKEKKKRKKKTTR